jgi:hypothetical protein
MLRRTRIHRVAFFLKKRFIPYVLKKSGLELILMRERPTCTFLTQGKHMSPRGRPTLESDKLEIVSFRMSDDLKHKLEILHQRDQNGVSFSQYIRHILWVWVQTHTTPRKPTVPHPFFPFLHEK